MTKSEARARSQRALSLGAFGSLLCSIACTTGPSTSHCRGAVEIPHLERRVETLVRSGRPALVLVERDGDPHPAAALAVAVEGGPQVSWSLATVVESRLTELGFAARAAAHREGFWVHALLKNAEDAERFVRESPGVLAISIAANQSLAGIRARISAAQLPTATEVDRDVIRCSADPFLDSDSRRLPDNDDAARAELERWRVSLALRTMAVAVVGSKTVLEAADDANASAGALPFETSPPESFDPWPAEDSLRVSPKVGPATLSVALRIANSADAQWVARELADPNDPLHVVSKALDPTWRLDRIVAVGRPRGACLRVDLHSNADPSLTQAAALADFVSGEAKRLLPHADSPEWVLQDAVLGLDDPREAANVAAWQALSARLEPGPDRVAVSYSAQGSNVDVASFRSAQKDLEKARKTAAIETVSAIEAGHGKLTVLLASPCGTLGETSDDAGELATMTSAVARAFDEDEKVHLSPWVTPDAVGLLVESDSQSSAETPNAQAERAAREIAKALLAPLESSAIHGARQSALAGFGKSTPDWWLALETLAPRQLSALSPQGSWTSVGSLVNDQIIAARRLFVSGPLRLAVLAGGSDTQAQVIHSELSRLLGPLRPIERQCPTPVPVKAGTGLFRMEAVADPRAQALVAVGLPPASHWSRASEAEWTVFLLNRKGGWLERRLLAPGLVIDARAQLLGGRRARAIVIELHTLDENAEAAVTETRRLLLDLARSAVTEADLAAAGTFFHEQAEHLSLDPRQRVVALWQGGGTASQPSLESLQKLHAETFREDHHLVVIAQ